MEHNGISERQRSVYDYIVAYMLEHQYAPTVREICEGVGLRSTSSVYSHLEKLKKCGLLTYEPMQPRTIHVYGYKLVKNEGGTKEAEKLIRILDNIIEQI